MNDLKTITALVRAFLETDKQCRNSDSFLYLKILEFYGKKKGIDIHSISIPYFLLNLKGMGFPPFESVRRARQKLQEHNPELAACEAVADSRAFNEEEYKKYAKEKV